MKVKKLTINNFRSYYGEKKFEFSDGLNLILGSNGDGKTTFFSALNWVLIPDYAEKNDEDAETDYKSLVSAKMFKELIPGGTSGSVSVSMEIKLEGGQRRVIERQFSVFKDDKGEMQIRNKSHKAFLFAGTIKKEIPSVKDVFEKENAFPAVIKKYHIFKGEDRLNIFEDKTTLQNLIDMFSEIKDIDSYKAFAAFAERTSMKSVDGARDKADKANRKLMALQTDIATHTRSLAEKESQKDEAKRMYDEAVKQIEAIDSDYEIIQKISELEKSVAKNENLILGFSDRIDDDYNIKLLDEQWILMGFASILTDYNRKMESFSTSKNTLEDDYRKKQEAEIAKIRVEKAKSQLEKVAWNMYDIEKMKHSLYAHRCVYCGTEAKEGSVAHDFLKQRINDVAQLLVPGPEEKRPEIKRLFALKNIEEMQQLGNSLAHAGKDIKGIFDEIDSVDQENNDIRADIAELSVDVENARNEIAELYANSSTGENLKDYVSNISVVNKWHEQKSSAASTYNRLRKEIPIIKEKLNAKKKEQAKNVKANGNGGLLMIHNLFRLLRLALDNAGDAIYDDFLKRLAEKANEFLAKLNVDDFTGIIKIFLDRFNELTIELQDKNGQKITNPNTSLLTTMHISILFAISEMTKETKKEDYPLVFDAPTSSFDEGKDKTFYGCLDNHIKKQCIVVTKSFLYKDEAGEFVLDKKGLEDLHCKKYRIKKLTGFDKLDITTIDTQVEEIKEDE